MREQIFTEQRTAHYSGGVTITLGTQLFFFEMVRFHRSEYWYGWTRDDIIGAASGMGCYLVLCLLMSKLVRRFAPQFLHPSTRNAFVFLVTAAIVYTPLLLSWPGLRGPIAAGVTLNVALVAALFWLIPRVHWLSAAQMSTVIVVGYLAASATTIWAAYYYLLDGGIIRKGMVVRYGVGSLAIVLPILLLVWILARRRTTKFMWCILSFAVPPALYWTGLFLPNLFAVEGGPKAILVTVDTLRADVCSVYGGPAATPSLEQLASKGVAFDKYYSLAPWTAPSMIGLLSSTYPKGLTPGKSHEEWLVEMRQQKLPPGVPTLAELMKAQGCITGGFTANSLLRHSRGMTRGYDLFALYGAVAVRRTSPVRSLPFLQDLLFTLNVPLVERRPPDTSVIMTSLAKTFLKRYANRPFFLWLHYMGPHTPLDPPKRYRPGNVPWPFLAPDVPNAFPGSPEMDKGRKLNLPVTQRPYVRALYEAAVRYEDECLGKVFDAVDTLGIADDTYICLTADHGEELWEHGGYFHGQTLYNELVHVPLIMTGPAIVPRRVETPVTALDVMPTLADLLSLETPEKWQGESLKQAVTDADLPFPDKPLFCGSTYIVAPEPMQAVINGDQKMIHRLNSDVREGYNLTEDPQEQHNLLPEAAEMQTQMDALLNEWRNSYETFFEPPDANLKETDTKELEDELKAVGYL